MSSLFLWHNAKTNRVINGLKPVRARFYKHCACINPAIPQWWHHCSPVSHPSRLTEDSIFPQSCLYFFFFLPQSIFHIDLQTRCHCHWSWLGLVLYLCGVQCFYLFWRPFQGSWLIFKRVLTRVYNLCVRETVKSLSCSLFSSKHQKHCCVCWDGATSSLQASACL